jgi:nitrogen fixation-related uncharacterized protein
VLEMLVVVPISIEVFVQHTRVFFWAVHLH